jgi:hypothetical protein
VLPEASKVYSAFIFRVSDFPAGETTVSHSRRLESSKHVLRFQDYVIFVDIESDLSIMEPKNGQKCKILSVARREGPVGKYI